MKYAPLFLLIAASSVQAQGWEWRRQPVTAEDRCEIKRIAKLTSLPKYQLDAVVESERTSFNAQSMKQYNRELAIPQPLAPTPVVVPPRRSPFFFFHNTYHSS